MENKRTVLITGGAGFIGSHTVRHFVKKYPEYLIINFDVLTYAGNLENLTDIENAENYVFYQGDIRNITDIETVFKKYNVTDVIHLAAESHVDKSISNPNVFVETNILGTANLLNVAKNFWNADYNKHRFHHVSTDEVYGSLDMNPQNKFTELTPYHPHSPYSASKASSDLLVQAYHDTDGLNTTISNCSNNYGPNQFPEKLIPLVLCCIMDSTDIPVYGTGENVRDWLYVEDHVNAIDLIFHNGKPGERYNIGGNNELTNIQIIDNIIIAYVNSVGNLDELSYEELHSWINILKHKKKFIADRKGHDLRYAIDATKIKNELGWEPTTKFNDGIMKTVKWYTSNPEWIEHVKTNEYKSWIAEQYKK